MAYDPAAYEALVAKYMAQRNAANPTPYIPAEQVSSGAAAQAPSGNPLTTLATNYAIKKGLGSLGGSGAGSAGSTAVASTADGGVVLANGTTVQGVASAANGGTVLADGTVVGAPANTLGSVLPSGGGALGTAGGAAALAAYLSNIYEGGAKDIVKGKGKPRHFANLVMDVNPVTAPINMGLRLFGQKSLGNMLFGGSKTNVEDSRYGRLSGITGFNKPFQATSDPHAGFRKDLAEDFVGYTDEKNKQGFVNNKFAKSRDVKDLRPDDITGFAAFGEKYGNDWYGKYNDEQRRGIAKTLLDAGAVSEGKGTLNVAWSPTLEDKVKTYLAAPPPKKGGNSGKK